MHLLSLRNRHYKSHMTALNHGRQFEINALSGEGQLANIESATERETGTS